MKISRLVLAIPLVFLSLSANANTINYTLDDLGGGRWQYNYEVDNTGGDVIDNIVVYFDDVGVYENLLVAAQPADWDSFVDDPIPGFDDGIFDSLGLVAGIDPGAMLGGFSVAFDFLGGGTPGDQFFELYDFLGNFLGDGVTTLVDTPQPVPEPSLLALLAWGLALLALRMASRRYRQTGYSAR